MTKTSKRGLSLRPSYWRWFLRGFIVGILAPSFYLAMGGEYIWGVPTWIRIIFYPGFVAGYFIEDYLKWLDASREVACGVGVVVVGITYGVIAMGAAFLIRRFLPLASDVQPKNQ